jgi:hypothetical protein
MASAAYKGHLLVWTAQHDANSDQWRPHVIISWNGANGAREFHQIKGPLMLSPKAAAIMAKQLGEAWVDRKF